mmetsp:Transcript_49475/g.158306  ORF Transcript_49475/g.158306 Transcript_49475/m.158306 type:complete len:220 (-) Transcript_49475:1225-1884(-)
MEQVVLDGLRLDHRRQRLHSPPRLPVVPDVGESLAHAQSVLTQQVRARGAHEVDYDHGVCGLLDARDHLLEALVAALAHQGTGGVQLRSCSSDVCAPTSLSRLAQSVCGAEVAPAAAGSEEEVPAPRRGHDGLDHLAALCQGAPADRRSVPELRIAGARLWAVSAYPHACILPSVGKGVLGREGRVQPLSEVPVVPQLRLLHGPERQLLPRLSLPPVHL